MRFGYILWLGSAGSTIFIQERHGPCRAIQGESYTTHAAAKFALAETNGFVVIQRESIEQEQDFPYAPIIDRLRSNGVNWRYKIWGARSGQPLALVKPRNPN